MRLAPYRTRTWRPLRYVNAKAYVFIKYSHFLWMFATVLFPVAVVDSFGNRFSFSFFNTLFMISLPEYNHYYFAIT
jgi:hypothetical protein